MSESVSATSGGPESVQMDAHSHVQGADDQGCVISPELMRSIAERARAGRFRRALDRMVEDPA